MRQCLKQGCRNWLVFLKRQNDRQELMEFVEQNKERIENMDEETFDAVSIVLSLPKKILKRKKHIEGARHNMCRAMKEWIADERKEGETRFVSLTSILLSSQRLDDLNKAVSDENFRNSLYQEFAL